MRMDQTRQLSASKFQRSQLDDNMPRLRQQDELASVISQAISRSSLALYSCALSDVVLFLLDLSSV